MHCLYMYVAVTRARDQLIIVGDMNHLRHYNPWNIVHQFFTGYDYRRTFGRRRVAEVDQFLSGQPRQ